ncbi:MAG: hypothetical protein WC622_15045 [Pedobacter sp.]|jgi:hypothetical protein|uniref:hypothetical protein n=1 Tax=Pedobacter sp. TaxID=1411316 RepID=UPI003562D581
MKSQSLLLKFPIKLLIAIILCIATLSACKKEDARISDATYREIAWNYLDPSSKTTVTTQWQKASVTYEKRDNKDMVTVMFNTTQDALLGPIFVYIDSKNQKVVGIGARF